MGVVGVDINVSSHLKEELTLAIDKWLQVVSTTVQLNLNFTCICRYTRVLACLTRAKLQKLAYACTVACDFGMYTRDSKHTQHMRYAYHELALGLPHHTCGVTTGTVAVGNEIQLLCS